MKDEVHTRTVLQARISSDSSDVSKSSAETIEKKEKVRRPIVADYDSYKGTEVGLHFKQRNVIY